LQAHACGSSSATGVASNSASDAVVVGHGGSLDDIARLTKRVPFGACLKLCFR
jgi:hypothetical protein